MELILIRSYFPGGTNGRLYIGDAIRPLCRTIELPWLNNIPGRSCIPEGKYMVRLRFSERFGKHMEVVDVPGRSLILFHPANDALSELRGCIAPVTINTGEGKGARSRMAFDRLLLLVKSNVIKAPVYITIKS